ncbi:MAG: hypothetical protein ABIK96_03730 [bacterium]
MKRFSLMTASLLLLLLPFAAQAECFIGGNIEAVENPDPFGPAWIYTLTVSWDNDVQFDLSHMDLLLDAVGGNCTQADFSSILSWGDPIGSSDGNGGCTVYYHAELTANGDPSIPDVTGILLKFEPYEDGCEPENVGTATFVFYSDLAPVPVDEEILSLVDKFAGLYCFGTLTGFFPGMDCDPVDSEAVNWGTVKGIFR